MPTCSVQGGQNPGLGNPVCGNPTVSVGGLVRKSGSEVAQSCLTLVTPMVCSPQGSSIPGNFQARILERVAISFSRERAGRRVNANLSRQSPKPSLRGVTLGVHPHCLSLFVMSPRPVVRQHLPEMEAGS